MNEPTKEPEANGSLKTFTCDLSELYATPGHALYTDLPSRVNPRAMRLLAGYKKLGHSVPLTESGHALLSGGEQFHALGRREKHYYPPSSDRLIIANNIDLIIPLIHKDVWVDICSGYADKVVYTLSKAVERYSENHPSPLALRHDATDAAQKATWPHHIILSDQNLEALRRGAENIAKIGFPRKRIHVVNGDVLDPGVWNNLRGKIDELKGVHSPVTMFGATFNDFDRAQRSTILAHFCSLNEHTREQSRPHFLVGIDNTVDAAILDKAYNNTAMKQFFLAAAEDFLRTKVQIQRPFDPSKADVIIKVIEKDTGPHIHFTVKDERYAVTWNTIEKVHFWPTLQQIAEVGVELSTTQLSRKYENFDGVEYYIWDLVAKRPSAHDRTSTNLLAQNL